MPSSDPRSKGGVRRYLDSTKPEEYFPDIGECDLQEMSLAGLFDLFGSDKGNLKHQYSVVYSDILKRFLKGGRRQEATLKLAEFGVACGSSLKSWAAYLPKSEIYGFDIRPGCEHLCAANNRISIKIQDVTKPALHASGYNEFFDLVIDDASHIAEDIIKALSNAWGWVKPGGAYVIEDLACTYSERYSHEYIQLFNREPKNDRELLMSEVDTILRKIDSKTSDISHLQYYPQLLVLFKAEKK